VATKPELLQGTLDMMILKTLTAGPLHGYAVLRRIQQPSEEVLEVEEGSLYPALHRMERRGWIDSEWGPSENNRRARFYKLAKAGRSQMEVETSSWATLSTAKSKVMQTTISGPYFIAIESTRKSRMSFVSTLSCGSRRASRRGCRRQKKFGLRRRLADRPGGLSYLSNVMLDSPAYRW
jgi:PadR family transcriptional regulator, regulatory protein PadR